MRTNYCPQCGTRLVTAVLDGRDREHCPACDFVAYRNPAPVAMSVIEHDGRLVLIRRALPPLADYWAPPAGYVEVGESVPEAAIREAREESGLVIEIDRLVGVFSQADVNVLIVAYAAHSVGGQPIAGDDACDLALIEPGAMLPQPAPLGGGAVDSWLHGVIATLTAPWGRDPSAAPTAKPARPRRGRAPSALRLRSSETKH